MKGEAARILVVDDERLIRWSLDQQLRREGYGVRLAETGAEALQAARTEPPDLVLLDLNLPGKNGYDVLLEVKTDAGLRHIPILVLTALGPDGAETYFVSNVREMYSMMRMKPVSVEVPPRL